ncbi:MAG: rhamnan synthesis F family protein [Rhodocyclaceae bacterium]
MSSFLKRLSNAFRQARKAAKARLPYVRRREYRILRRRHDALIDALIAVPRQATEAAILAVKPLQAYLAGEICLFVTHATLPELKPHVRFHIECLVDEGFKVVLVVNTDIDATSIVIDAPLRDLLTAAYVRENVGFDFGAWGHAYAIGNGLPGCSRLLLVNDSMVGPLNKGAFTRLVSRLRESTADVVGLTQNTEPQLHLQSYFLAFGPRALASEVFRRVFSLMHALPTKELVIDAYETALTRHLVASGLKIVALFPPMYNDSRSADDTLLRWRELVDAGFPYVKASLLHSPQQCAAVRTCIPAHLMPRI